LANIAGYTVEDTTVFGLERTYALFKDGSFDSNFRAWQPHKDIAQAFEVLEGLGNDNVFLSKSNIKTDVSWEVEIWDIGLEDESIIIVSDSLTLAICKAVLKATEQG